MDKNESFWQAMKNGLPLGAVFFGALVGPVMVTGSYTMNYFLKYGIKGWLICPFYALCIFIWFYCGFTHTRITAESNPDKNVYDYTMLAKALYGKYTFMVPLYDLWILLAMVLTAASTIATGGMLIASFLGSAYVVGAVVMAALVTVVAIFGADIVRKASTVMMFGLIGLMILLLVITFVHKGGAQLLSHFIRTDTHGDRISRPGFFPYRSQNLIQQPHSIFKRASVFIRSMVKIRA